ncbi:MAG: PQQ-binding-like beta-propeller repeat protein [Chloroflexaceae bacterium]|nr:PQQ-binding-like beta-propeller repeat protein [Chloroflexaceae bacterium]
MNQRGTVTLVLAVVIIMLIMGTSAGLAWNQTETAKYTQHAGWSYAMTAPVTLQLMDLTGDGRTNLFAQNDRSIALLNPDGSEHVRRQFDNQIMSTLGDINNDAVEEMILALTLSPGVAALQALNASGEQLWSAQANGLRSQPSRVRFVRFDSGWQVVVGDEDGQLMAFDLSGNEVWRTNLSSGDIIRGLDDTTVDGVRYLAAANQDGSVALYDASGLPRWTYQLGEPIRRLRTFDLDGDNQNEIVLGGDAGRLVLLQAADGSERFSISIGQSIAEIRDGELNGDPSSRELVVGGRDGGVWAYSLNGAALWSAAVADRVRDIVVYDQDGNGVDDVLVGDRSGGLTLFTGSSGSRFPLAARSAEITSMEAGTVNGQATTVVGDQVGMQTMTIRRETAPWWYNPLLIGVLLSIGVAVVAWFFATNPARPAVEVSAVDQSIEGLRAQRTMLYERIADVERLRDTGEMPAEAYLLRLRDLRKQLADIEAAMLKAGEAVQVQTVKCPNCGGSVTLGSDRCDYCGQVIIR